MNLGVNDNCSALPCAEPKEGQTSTLGRNGYSQREFHLGSRSLLRESGGVNGESGIVDRIEGGRLGTYLVLSKLYTTVRLSTLHKGSLTRAVISINCSVIGLPIHADLYVGLEEGSPSLPG